MKYFTLKELTKSTVARNNGIKNEPDALAKTSLALLVEKVLDPLREAWGAPIFVTSGYRSEALNRAVNGVPTSEHLYGRAADITAGSPEKNKELFDLAIALDLPFRQLIDEKNYSWLHISYNPNDIKRQTLHLK